ncbi:unnamed protein product [Owenia fusiformis]|uniref:Uncharacterized protein n=1 Tax=Owenia fusiformis TaxID=6347 RepID=A0A8J1UI37_OWEFU|nr:unnamed protein product [Owenia fusiformis]
MIRNITKCKISLDCMGPIGHSNQFVKFFIFIILCLLLQTGDFKVCNLDSRPAQDGVCGDKLPELVKLFCANYGGTYSPPGKRTMESRGIDKRPVPKARPGFLMDKREAQTFLQHVQKRALVCECCFHACNYQREIRKYCAY